MAATASAVTVIHTLYSTPPWVSHNPCAPLTVAIALIITPIKRSRRQLREQPQSEADPAQEFRAAAHGGVHLSGTVPRRGESLARSGEAVATEYPEELLGTVSCHEQAERESAEKQTAVSGGDRCPQGGVDCRSGGRAQSLRQVIHGVLSSATPSGKVPADHPGARRADGPVALAR